MEKVPSKPRRPILRSPDTSLGSPTSSKTFQDSIEYAKDSPWQAKGPEFKKNRPRLLSDLDTTIGENNSVNTSVKTYKVRNPLVSPTPSNFHSLSVHYFDKNWTGDNSSITNDKSLSHVNSQSSFIPYARNRGKEEIFLPSLVIPRKRKAFKNKNSKDLSPLRSPSSEIWNTYLAETSDQKEKLAPRKIRPMDVAEKIIYSFQKSVNAIKSSAVKNHAQPEIDADIQELAQTLQESLQIIKTILEGCIDYRKNKEVLEKYLALIVQHAQKSKNIELHLEALKIQGKILLLYSDLHKAINIFKTVKHMADANRSFTNKLKSYKYLGRCFQAVHNHPMAIFYYVKLLQTAWLCNSTRYELLAYDLMGVQYYYMGDLEKAKYYHQSMMAGEVEPKHSELRKLGIDKIMNKLLEEPCNSKKQFQIKTIEEELTGYDIPYSEDEFELPSPRNQIAKKKLDEIKAAPEENQDSTTTKQLRGSKSLPKINSPSPNRAHALKLLLENGQRYKRKMAQRPKFVEEKEVTSMVSVIKARNESQLNPPTPQIRLTHLSPNRFLNNFHIKDPRYIASSFLLRGSHEDGLILLDSKSVEKIRKKLERFKGVVEKALTMLFNLTTEKIEKPSALQTIQENKQRIKQRSPSINSKSQLFPILDKS